MHHPERPLGRRAVRLRAGVRRVRQQRPGGGRPAGRGRGVGRVLRAADELLGVVRGVVEGTVLGGEPVQDQVDQEPGELQPDPLPRHGRQREEALGDVAVILQHPGIRPGPAVLAGAGQPRRPARRGLEVDTDQQVGGLGGPLDQVRPVEVRPALGERGDRQAVPGGDDLVVAARRGPLGARRQQPPPDVRDPLRVHDRPVLGQLEHGRPVLEGPLLGHPEVRGGQRPVGLPEHLRQAGGRPGVVRPLRVPTGGRVLAVRVERGREAALGGAQFPDHEVGGLQRDTAREVGAGGPPEVRVDAAQKRIVVKHLLEVRDDPLPVHGVPCEPAPELVVDPAAGHRLAGVGGHLQRPLGARPGVVAQQELQHHRRRELRRPAEPAAHGVVLPGQPEQRLRQLLRAGGAGLAVVQLPPGQVPHDPLRDLSHLVRTAGPGALHAFEDLHEGRHPVPGLRREVGSEIERLGLRSHEHRHRPSALAGGGLHGLHVDGVHVRPLFAVDFDVDEVLVHVGGRQLVLEGLVRHDVAPVLSLIHRCV